MTIILTVRKILGENQMESFGKLTIKAQMLITTEKEKCVTVLTQWCDYNEIVGILLQFKENNSKLATLCHAEFSIVKHFDI